MLWKFKNMLLIFNGKGEKGLRYEGLVFGFVVGENM